MLVVRAEVEGCGDKDEEEDNWGPVVKRRRTFRLASKGTFPPSPIEGGNWGTYCH